MILPFKKKKATKVQTLKSKPQEVKVPISNKTKSN